MNQTNALDLRMETPTATRNSKGHTILFVDDDERFLDLCVKRFRDTEYDVKTSCCAEEALEILAAGPIDVVVSDMSMPMTSGAELMKTVRELYPQTVRIIVSGRFDFTDTLQAINTGHVDHYITKPFNDKDLKLTIYKALLKRERLLAESVRQKERVKNASNRARELGETVVKSKKDVARAYDEVTNLMVALLSRNDSKVCERAELCVHIARRAELEAREICTLRVAALMANIARLQDASLEGDDCHTESAELIACLTPFRKSATLLREIGRDKEDRAPSEVILKLSEEYWRARERVGHAEAVEELSMCAQYDSRLLLAVADWSPIQSVD